MTWQPLIRAVAYHQGNPVVEADNESTWMNDEYVVKRTEQNDELVWLSIRRDDRQPARSWRDFQRIKNQLAGPEWEGVEIYPAESRKVDGANQYHLFCFPFRLGFGFNERMVMEDVSDAPGAVQEPMEPVDLEHGGMTVVTEEHRQRIRDARRTL